MPGLKLILYMMSVAALLSCSKRSNHDSKNVGASSDSISYQSKVMLDGKRWLTENLSVDMPDSHCSKNDEQFCKKYGRLYTWKTAQKVCSTLGSGWRLPTNEEWQTMSKFYGGVYDDSKDQGKSAYVKLIEGGDSGFNAVLGGNREANGSYERLEAHGFYWTASEYDSANAWFYNFAKGATLLNHHTGDKHRAASVRCVKDAI